MDYQYLVLGVIVLVLSLVMASGLFNHFGGGGIEIYNITILPNNYDFTEDEIKELAQDHLDQLIENTTELLNKSISVPTLLWVINDFNGGGSYDSEGENLKIISPQYYHYNLAGVKKAISHEFCHHVTTQFDCKMARNDTISLEEDLCNIFAGIDNSMEICIINDWWGGYCKPYETKNIKDTTLFSKCVWIEGCKDNKVTTDEFEECFERWKK